jgi:Gametolysin peptidase M11/NPCBM-associated, NEW3 domain of alpha-galactosidase
MNRRSRFRCALTLSLAATLCITLCPLTSEAQTTATFERGWQRGTPMTVQGALTAVYADDFEHQHAELLQYIRDEQTGRVFRVHFDAEVPTTLRSRSAVTLSGHAEGSELYVLAASIDAGMSTLRAANTASTSALVSGDQRTLVMIADFRDVAVSCSADAIAQRMFTEPTGYSVAGLYRASSDGRVSFSGAVVGPLTLTSSSTDTCDPGGWASQARAAATASGVDVSAYTRRVYVMPPNSCEAAGYAYVGGMPSDAWIFSCGVRGVYAHEIGHNLGMDHASTPTNEFGDETDPMTFSDNWLRGVNAPHKHQLGWLGETGARLVTANGVYDVAALAMDPNATSLPKALLIAKNDTGDRYYISFRDDSNVFERSIHTAYQGRVSIHRYKGDGSPTRTFLMAGLSDGERFDDPVNGITITAVGHTSSSATVRIDFLTPCVIASPTLATTPAQQSGAAGTGAQYIVSLTNYDSATCPATSFTLSAAVPSGWTGALSTSSVTIAPGASAQTTLTINVPSSAAPGSYSSPIAAADVTGRHAAASGTASYTVEFVDTVPPTAPERLATRQRQSEIQLSWNASTDNVGVTGYRVLRDGVAVGTTSTNSWSDSNVTTGTTYTYVVVASDRAGNQSSPSNSVSVTVSGGNGKKPR